MKNFQSVKKGGKKCKCGISGVRKKNERKVPGKKIRVFWKGEEKKKVKIFVVLKKMKLFGFGYPVSWASC